jgi:hypothetical protein
MHSRYIWALLDQAWTRFVISRLGMIRVCAGDPQIHKTSEPHRGRGSKVVSSSKPLVEEDSRDPLLRTWTPFHLANAADLVSCAEHQHTHPPSRYSNTGSTAVVLESNQLAIIKSRGQRQRDRELTEHYGISAPIKQSFLRRATINWIGKSRPQHQRRTGFSFFHRR